MQTTKYLGATNPNETIFPTLLATSQICGFPLRRVLLLIINAAESWGHHGPSAKGKVSYAFWIYAVLGGKG